MQRNPSLDARLSVLVPLAESELRDDWLRRCLGFERSGAAQVDEIWIAASPSVPDRLLNRLEREGCRTLRSAAPRGERLRAAASECTGELLLFLHGDTRLEAEAVPELRAAGAVSPWGAFRLRFENDRSETCLPIIARAANTRARLFGLPYGDQAQWATRAAYEQIGGHPSWNFLDDLELARRLRKLSRPTLLRSKAITSARRYERDGRMRSVWTNCRILARFARGGDPAQLELLYRRGA